MTVQDTSFITLTRAEIQDLYEFAMLGGDGPDNADQSFTIAFKEAGQVYGDDNEPMSAGYYVCETDCEEEGWTKLGPDAVDGDDVDGGEIRVVHEFSRDGRDADVKCPHCLSIIGVEGNPRGEQYQCRCGGWLEVSSTAKCVEILEDSASQACAAPGAGQAAEG